MAVTYDWQLMQNEVKSQNLLVFYLDMQIVKDI